MSEPIKPKVKKMTPYTRKWIALAGRVARDYVSIYPCAECGGPVVQPYCCQRCGSSNPEGAR